MNPAGRNLPAGSPRWVRWTAALLLHSALCAAEPRGLPELDYSAAAGCPTQAQFSEHLQARTKQAWQRLRLSTPVEIRLEAGADNVRGRVQFRDQAGVTVRRELTAEDCQQLARALALVTALAFDANVDGASKHPTTKRTTTAAGAAPAGAARTASQHFGVGFDAFSGSAHAPLPSLGGQLYALWLSAERRVAARLGFGHLRSWAVESELGRARFEWSGVRLEFCPARWQARRFAFGPCFGAEGARLRGVPLDPGRLERGGPRSEWWWALDGSGRVELRATRELGFQLSAGLSLPLDQPGRPQRFVFLDENGDEVEIFEVPGVGAAVRLGLEYTLP